MKPSPAQTPLQLGPVRYALSFLLLLFVLPSLAQAHPGAGHAVGFLHGTTHPVTGLDHLCVMLAVGLWAAQRGGRATWLVPLTFVSVMALGGFLGLASVPLPLVEQGILASVLVLGVLIAAAVRLPLAATSILIGLFALFHGHAHGTEMPENASGLAYGLGFMLATACLHGCGIGLGLMVQRLGSARMFRYVGGAITACGIYLCLA
ncbi:MAG: HupE/UreJ family protein [Candidatus Methylacidiphilales bacterium]|nr:HupE/UreJ family protein [Candidatus Methylacidiphilales bacterium]